MEKHKLSISFRRQYKHIYDHLILQPNRSHYVCRLIDEDMNKKGQLSEEEIRRVVMEELGKQGIRQLDEGFRENDQLDEDTVELINKLF